MAQGVIVAVAAASPGNGAGADVFRTPEDVTAPVVAEGAPGATDEMFMGPPLVSPQPDGTAGAELP